MNFLYQSRDENAYNRQQTLPLSYQYQNESLGQSIMPDRTNASNLPTSSTFYVFEDQQNTVAISSWSSGVINNGYDWIDGNGNTTIGSDQRSCKNNDVNWIVDECNGYEEEKMKAEDKAPLGSKRCLTNPDYIRNNKALSQSLKKRRIRAPMQTPLESGYFDPYYRSDFIPFYAAIQHSTVVSTVSESAVESQVMKKRKKKIRRIGILIFGMVIFAGIAAWLLSKASSAIAKELFSLADDPVVLRSSLFFQLKFLPGEPSREDLASIENATSLFYANHFKGSNIPVVNTTAFVQSIELWSVGEAKRNLQDGAGSASETYSAVVEMVISSQLLEGSSSNGEGFQENIEEAFESDASTLVNEIASISSPYFNNVQDVVLLAWPSSKPTQVPTKIPSRRPSSVPSVFPSISLNPSLSLEPTVSPTITTGPSQSNMPSSIPSTSPSVSPSLLPSVHPTIKESSLPSSKPSISERPSISLAPSMNPSKTAVPTASSPPSDIPSLVPSLLPTKSPSEIPTFVPSEYASEVPSIAPSMHPSSSPSLSYNPSTNPSNGPSSGSFVSLTPSVSIQPSISPSAKISVTPSTSPSFSNSLGPSATVPGVPSIHPSLTPNELPSYLPSFNPSSEPSLAPAISTSSRPSTRPSFAPISILNNSSSPSRLPSFVPSISSKPSENKGRPVTNFPSMNSSSKPSKTPSTAPSKKPSDNLSVAPSQRPSGSRRVTTLPSTNPSSKPNRVPSRTPSKYPSAKPSFSPSQKPTRGHRLTSSPSKTPSKAPSMKPSLAPSQQPSKARRLTNSPSTIPSSNPSKIPSKAPTMKPSEKPSQGVQLLCSSASIVPSPRLLYVQDQILSYQDLSTLSDENTVEHSALCSVLEQESTSTTTSSDRDIKERYVLSVFYFQTAGSNWLQNTRWLTNEPHCSWYGVSCSNSEVSEMVFQNNNIGGTLPYQLSFLQSLKKLILPSNRLSGSLPPQLDVLNNLEKLDLDNNNISGQFPDLGGPNLKYVSLRANSFSGELPDSLFNMGNLLEYLDASENSFRGVIFPSIGNLIQLQVLRLQNNAFNGSITSNIVNCVSLHHLNLTGNSFTGNIPASIFMPSLETLRLGKNSFVGLLPSITNMPNVEYLEFGNNYLYGQLPSISAGSLKKLSLEGNKFNGTIPDSLASLVSAESIHLHHNELYGRVSSEICSLNSQITADCLSGITCNCCVCYSSKGSLVSRERAVLETVYDSLGGPSWISNTNWKTNPNFCLWSRVTCNNDGLVEKLDLQANNLQGFIPTDIGILSNMKKLRLGFNNIQGTIPTELGLLPLSQGLDLESNQLFGSLPSELFAQPRMIHSLSVAKNYLSGEIPQNISNIYTSYLWMYDNKFSGNIPQSLGSISGIAGLSLATNSLLGEIPPSLGQIGAVTWGFYLDNNIGLTGAMPSGLCGSRELTVDCSVTCGCCTSPTCHQNDPSNPVVYSTRTAFNVSMMLNNSSNATIVSDGD